MSSHLWEPLIFWSLVVAALVGVRWLRRLPWLHLTPEWWTPGAHSRIGQERRSGRWCVIYYRREPNAEEQRRYVSSREDAESLQKELHRDADAPTLAADAQREGLRSFQRAHPETKKSGQMSELSVTLFLGAFWTVLGVGVSGVLLAGVLWVAFTILGWR